jgi:hypothetical protein
VAWHNTKPRERSQRAPAAFIDPCLPTKAHAPPEGEIWAHEIKHDGYRIQIHTGPDGVRIYTMTGHDWTDRYPLIASAAAKLKGSAIDAEAAIVDADGMTDFDALHDRQRNAEAVAFGFDMMMLDCIDLRPLPWLARQQSVSCKPFSTSSFSGRSRSMPLFLAPPLSSSNVRLRMVARPILWSWPDGSTAVGTVRPDGRSTHQRDQ